jgi:lysozyme family protein
MSTIPADPGGATNKGVTFRVYDAYRARRGLPRQDVRHITSAEVADIYRI